MAIGRPAEMLFVPAATVVQRDPARFGLLKEISQFHGAYSSAKARRDVPEFKCEIDFVSGAADTLKDVRRRDAWKSSDGDAVYRSIVDSAISTGIAPVSL